MSAGFPPEITKVFSLTRAQEYQVIAQCILPRFDGVSTPPCFLEASYLQARYLRNVQGCCETCLAPFRFGDRTWRNYKTIWKHHCDEMKRQRRALVRSLHPTQEKSHVPSL